MCQPYLIQSVGLAIAAALFLGCSSTGGGKSSSDRVADGTEVELLGGTEPIPYDATATEEQRAAGILLAEIDQSLRAWNNIVLDGKASEDLTRLDLLETTLRHKVRTNQKVLEHQLQTGALVNRQIAAAALGFSGDSDALGPLLGALQDPNDDVVANALLGLSTLQSPDTQVGGIASLFSDRSKPVNVRSNAGRTLRTIRLGALDESSRDQVIESARLALGDEEASVRVHGSLILAELVDQEGIQRLSLLLMDPSPLVARAASRSIARIGSMDQSLKGRAARALTSFIDKVDRQNVRKSLLDDLQRMAQVNYGENTEAWVEYAHKLP